MTKLSDPEVAAIDERIASSVDYFKRMGTSSPTLSDLVAMRDHCAALTAELADAKECNVALGNDLVSARNELAELRSRLAAMAKSYRECAASCPNSAMSERLIYATVSDAIERLTNNSKEKES